MCFNLSQDIEVSSRKLDIKFSTLTQLLFVSGSVVVVVVTSIIKFTYGISAAVELKLAGIV